MYFALKKRMHLSQSKLGFLEKWPFLKGFSRCHCDSYPTTSIPCAKASWGRGFRLAVFDLENGCRGDQLNLYKGGYLTILDPLPSPFSSRVCLSRQVFCAQISWQELHIPVVWVCLQPFCNFLACYDCYAGAARYQLLAGKDILFKTRFAPQSTCRAPRSSVGCLHLKWILKAQWKANTTKTTITLF